MAFSKAQIKAIQTARNKSRHLRDEDTWRLFLRNCQGIHRDAKGNPRVSDSRNTQAAYEEVRWRLAEVTGNENEMEYWFHRVCDRGERVRHALKAYAAECERLGLLEPGGLGGFVWRMTAPLGDEERTRELDDLHLDYLLVIVRGLVPWMTRKAAEMREAGAVVSAPKFGHEALSSYMDGAEAA